MSQKHKVFISFHSVDLFYKNTFESLFHDKFDVIVSRAVGEGDISDTLATETVRQKIRDEYLRDSTVTVVLIGKETWQRKHVDWEISSSIRHTPFNARSGLIGIVLPSYPGYKQNSYDSKTIPPRLYYNLELGFARLHLWNTDPTTIQKWIHEAFLRKNSIIPINTYPPFGKNRIGDGWQ